MSYQDEIEEATEDRVRPNAQLKSLFDSLKREQEEIAKGEADEQPVDSA